MSSSNTSSNQSPSPIWNPLKTLRDTKDTSSLCTSQDKQPRLAKDSDYASSVLSAWRVDIVKIESTSNDENNKISQSLGRTCVYTRADGALFNGYIVAPSTTVESESSDSKPVVLLFHTGAGPQDVFLRWKADCLVQELKCVVMIVDIISDKDGFAWSDRNKYETARKEVLRTFEKDGIVARWNLRDTIDSALDYLHELQYIDSTRVAGLGYCMGGHPIFELGMMRKDSVKALVSYHGVFDGTSQQDFHSRSTASATKILICNGKKDPFVPAKDLEFAVDLLQKAGNDVEVLPFDCCHGFTNPAQDFNPSESFAFNKYAASTSWEETIKLLRKTMF